MVLRGQVLLCPLPRSSSRCFSRFDEGVKVMIFRGLVLLGSLTPSGYCCFFSLSRGSEGYGPSGSGTVVLPPPLVTRLFLPF